MARLQGRSSTKTVGGQSFKEFRAPCLADGETSFWEVQCNYHLLVEFCSMDGGMLRSSRFYTSDKKYKYMKSTYVLT